MRVSKWEIVYPCYSCALTFDQSTCYKKKKLQANATTRKKIIKTTAAKNRGKLVSTVKAINFSC